MKRLLALMLCFFLLTACTRQEVPVNTTMPSASTASTTFAAPELTGLTGENADNNYLVYNNFECMSESDSVIYKLVNARTSIYYYDKASGISGPLCGNPDCNHTTQDCEAFIGSAMALQYYNGNLYFIAGDLNSSSGMWLWKADVNGKHNHDLPATMLFHSQRPSFSALLNVRYKKWCTNVAHSSIILSFGWL